MGRTTGPDDIPDRPRKGDHGRGPRSTQSRNVLISKALSRLLRHQAVNEGVPITDDGWVRLDHVLAWKGLSGRNGVSPPPTVEEIFQVVEENEKKRFALKLADGTTQLNDPTEPQQQPKQPQSAPTDPLSTQPNSTGADTPSTDPDSTTTALALQHHRTSTQTPPPGPQTYLIRANQGHSIQAIASSSSLLTPITLSALPPNPTCVHGTFYGAWPTILASGGLKRMGRNHVHFATGPTMGELGISLDVAGDGNGASGGVSGAEVSSKVISGMRRDAQVLIYVDLRRCLEEEGERMKWWRSENGVLLTEGVEYGDGLGDTPMEGVEGAEGSEVAMGEGDAGGERDGSASRGGRKQQNRKGKAAQASGQDGKMVPMKYWSLVVDVKGNHGVLWRQGEGVVNELPESLTSRGTPKHRGGGRGRGRGRGI